MLTVMDYCEHCEGQRFDRARVLRALRHVRAELRTASRRKGPEALDRAIRAVRELDIPHLDIVEFGDEIVH
jgi:hypothetical protein